MKALDVQDMLEHARCAVAVLRALKMTGQKMSFQQFARAMRLNDRCRYMGRALQNGDW
jgi:hypothetical protein